MLVVTLCLVMKILEYSSGRLIQAGKKRFRKKKKAPGLAVGRGMNTADDLSLTSPASDCNSNNVETSYTSNTSELEFVQDNSDYQWCVDYGYREVSHRSVLSSCYDELARDLDSQLAQVDMEDYSAQEILSTLPAICCPDMQAERQGEMFASVSGSLMVKFDFDSSISPHTSSQDESSMSLCHSEPLFSPVKEAALPNYSVDSLDEGEQLIVTCQANKTNYTIAFHGSTVMGETSEYTDTGDSMMSVEEKQEGKMAASDAPTTTWSKLRRNPRGRRSRSKTVSLPDLGQGAPCLSASLALGGCVKLYDIQNSGSATSESFSGSGGPDLSSGSKQGNFSLLRMFIAQRANSADQNMENRGESRGQSVVSASLSACYEDSLVRESGSSVERLSSQSPSICTCSFSASSNKFNVNNNNSIERDVSGKVHTGTGMSGISDFSAGTNSSDPTGETKMCPLHTVDRAIQTSVREPSSANKEVTTEEKKPVYVLYPNYTLPDLGFLRGGPSAERVLLAPVKYTARSPGTPPAAPDTTAPYRTVTRRDLESLRQKGLDHVMDWSSLTPLLPAEYWSLLCELPQVRQHSAARLDKPAFLNSPNLKDPNTTPPHNFGIRGTNVNSSECSTGTAPSSGYRGSSTLLSESGGPTNTPACNTPASNPLYVYNYSGEERKSRKAQEGKRYSMFEFGVIEDNLNEHEQLRKRKSFPIEPPKEEDEGSESWDDWWQDTTKRPHSPPSTHANRLDWLLEKSSSEVSWQPQDIRILRDQVSKFLSEAGRKCVSFADKGDQQVTPPNSPTYQKTYHCKQAGLADIKQYPEEGCRSRFDFTNKKKLLERVVHGVEKVLEVLATEGSSADSLPATVLDSLCPPLYSLLSDGLRPKIDTAFGPISNSVWQVVEASAQQGPMTRALHELVMKLNSEDILSEGLIKFNAFIFGLLNVQGMDAWMSYIRTRESILSKHYTEESLLLSASRGHAKSRSLTDSLITSLRPLSRLHFHLDLLYETRLLHESLLQLAKLPLSPSSNSDITTDSLLLKKIVQSIKSGLSGGTLSGDDLSQGSEGTGGGGAVVSRAARPRSCVDPGSLQTQDLASTARKRWSTVHVGSRLVSAYDRLQSPSSQDQGKTIESGTKSSGSDDSTEVLDEDAKKTGGKFRSLQRKWELLSGKSQDNRTRIPRSRIPRPVTSPVRPVTMRVPTPASLQRRALSSIPTQRSSSREMTETKRMTETRPRTTGTVGRPPATTAGRRPPGRSAIPRTVVTLTHRLPSDSGHLAFNEGERLKLVLEVDDSWLLCCRGDAKGLVPRSAVI